MLLTLNQRWTNIIAYGEPELYLALFELNLNKMKSADLETVAEMEPEESAVISGFTDEVLANKLLEMGFLPGTAIRFNFKAPMGDPVCVTVSGFDLSLRMEEARSITILN